MSSPTASSTPSRPRLPPLRTLDRDIRALSLREGLPAARLGESEGHYNIRAAADPVLLLLDQRTISVGGRITPVEPCDLLSRAGAFNHVKHPVRSSVLSHLFSQGAVNGELLATSAAFRRGLRELITTVEEQRRAADGGYQLGLPGLIADEPPNRYVHEIVFAIVTRWGNRSPATAFPFFSKLNLRQSASELDQPGFKVALAKVTYE